MNTESSVILLILLALPGLYIYSAIKKAKKKPPFHLRENDPFVVELRTQARKEAVEQTALQQAKVSLRDAETQVEPYEYQCVGHPNNTLALRYGLANTNENGKPMATIKLRKIQKVEDSVYLCELPDFAGRKVKAVIRDGNEYVETFLPRSDDWFRQFQNFEKTLKDNPTFTLKELARFHVDKTL